MRYSFVGCYLWEKLSDGYPVKELSILVLQLLVSLQLFQKEKAFLKHNIWSQTMGLEPQRAICYVMATIRGATML